MSLSSSTFPPLEGRWLLPSLLSAALALTACGSRKAEFLGTRTEDDCNKEWPICSTIAGCLLGDTSYFEGKFPGEGRVVVEVFEPSTVTASFFLEEVGGSGEETAIDFFEDRCRARVSVRVGGKVFITESEKLGLFARSAELTGVGQHLIEFKSDASARYVVKFDVVPLRFKDSML